MNIRTMALIGGTIAVAFTSVMVACSSSSSGGGGSSSSGSSSGTTSSSGSSSGTTSSGGSSSGTLEDGGGADACTKKPPETHASTAEGGIYCPFSFDDATDSGSQYCANGTQQCCLSSGSDAGPSACVAFATSATPFTQSAGCGAATDSIWQCGAPTDCVQAGPVLPLADGGPGVASDAGPIVCCLLGGNLEANYDSCSNIQSTHFGGTSCQPASVCQGSIPVASGTKVYQDPLYTVCVTTADCPSPTSQTCTPIYTTGTPIGVCLPQ